MRYHEMGHSDFWTSFWRTGGKMVEISVEAKMYYGVAGSMGMHNLCCFRSRAHR